MLYGRKRENSLPDISLTRRVHSKRVQLREARSKKFGHAFHFSHNKRGATFFFLSRLGGGGGANPF